MRGASTLPENQRKAYAAFYDAAHENDIPDRKTTLLLHLAASFALGCYP